MLSGKKDRMHEGRLWNPKWTGHLLKRVVMKGYAEESRCWVGLIRLSQPFGDGLILGCDCME